MPFAMPFSSPVRGEAFAGMCAGVGAGFRCDAVFCAGGADGDALSEVIRFCGCVEACELETVMLRPDLVCTGFSSDLEGWVMGVAAWLLGVDGETGLLVLRGAAVGLGGEGRACIVPSGRRRLCQSGLRQLDDLDGL